MKAVEILSRINNRYQIAKIFHAESSHLFTLLALPGFSMLHEKQMIEETRTQMRLYQYIIQTYGEAPLEEIPENANVIHPIVKNRNRNEIKPDERRNIIKMAWDIYIKWESDTKKEYEKCAMELLSNGDIASYKYVSEIITDVSAELRYIESLKYMYENMDWDIGTIVEAQETLFELYIYQIREFYKNYHKYHHYNSAEIGKIEKEGKHKE